MDIGKQIKRYRTEMRLSQEELAERIFVSRQTISNWENDKNYPDVKSLVLLSSLFGISLDILIKGDVEKMKEKIKTEDITAFKRESTIFACLMVSTIVLPVPMMKFAGHAGMGAWALTAAVTMYYAVRIERRKKSFDMQTYKEIIAFLEGKNLNEIEKNREYGKRPYQKLLLAVGAGLVTVAAAVIMDAALTAIVGS